MGWALERVDEDDISKILNLIFLLEKGGVEKRWNYSRYFFER